MVQVLSEGIRLAAKEHQCFHCYRPIPKGERHGFQTNKYDFVYTLRWHIDCEACATEYRVLAGYEYDEDGYGPLRDAWCDSGEYDRECDWWRGRFPHVVARMELTDQLRSRGDAK